MSAGSLDHKVLRRDPAVEGILPTYHRLDIANITAQVGVVNAYNRANLFALYVFTLHRTDQLPLVPTAGIEVEF